MQQSAQVGITMGRGGFERWGFRLALHGYVLSHLCPLGSYEALSQPVKLYFLLIC